MFNDTLTVLLTYLGTYLTFSTSGTYQVTLRINYVSVNTYQVTFNCCVQYFNGIGWVVAGGYEQI